MPVVLDIRGKSLVSVIVLGLKVRLRKVGNSAQQEICPTIARGDSRIGAIERQKSLDIRRALFILLIGNEVTAKSQVVIAGDFRDHVAEGVDGVGIVDGTGRIDESRVFARSEERRVGEE